jgi:hypothetical protein
MRNPWVRRVFVGLIFAFPLLIGLASSRSLSRFGRELQGGSPIILVESVLLTGMVFATRQRRKLLVAIEAASVDLDGTAPCRSPALAGPRAVTKARSAAEVFSR